MYCITKDLHICIGEGVQGSFRTDLNGGRKALTYLGSRVSADEVESLDLLDALKEMRLRAWLSVHFGDRARFTLSRFKDQKELDLHMPLAIIFIGASLWHLKEVYHTSTSHASIPWYTDLISSCPVQPVQPVQLSLEEHNVPALSLRSLPSCPVT